MLNELGVIVILVFLLDTVHAFETWSYSHLRRFFTRRFKHVFEFFLFVLSVAIKTRVFFIIFEFFIWDLRGIHHHVFCFVYHWARLTLLLWWLFEGDGCNIFMLGGLLVDRLIIIFVVMILRRTSIHNFYSIVTDQIHSIQYNGSLLPQILVIRVSLWVNINWCFIILTSEFFLSLHWR